MRKALWVFPWMICLLIIGCAGTPTGVRPELSNIRTAHNELFDATLTPAKDQNNCMGFFLTVRNRTDANLAILWDETHYIYNGENKGKFMSKDAPMQDKDNPKMSVVIPPKGSYTDLLFPCSMVYNSGKGVGWFRMPLPEGENGIHLVVMSGNSIKSERLIFRLPAPVLGAGPYRNL